MPHASLHMGLTEAAQKTALDSSMPYLEQSELFQEEKNAYPMGPPICNPSQLYAMARYYVVLINRRRWSLEDIEESLRNPIPFFHPHFCAWNDQRINDMPEEGAQQNVNDMACPSMAFCNEVSGLEKLERDLTDEDREEIMRFVEK